MNLFMILWISKHVSPTKHVLIEICAFVVNIGFEFAHLLKGAKGKCRGVSKTFIKVAKGKCRRCTLLKVANGKCRGGSKQFVGFRQ